MHKKMHTKEKLLEFMELNKGKYFSGEDIAKELCVSRTAVWKAIKLLQGEGYIIDAVTNKGYCLSVASDVLSEAGVKKYLIPPCNHAEICILPTVSSTNAYAREMAADGADEWYTVIANEQTSGKGRFKRSFYSPRGTGLYISTLLRPKNLLPEQAVKITTMAAVAMCEAIEKISGEETQIKWVNDIYMHGKKLCGILTEAAFGMESGMLEYAVLGAGVNIYRPNDGFPPELCDIAGYIFPTSQNDVKNRLAAEFLNLFRTYYTNTSTDAYIEKYKKRSLVIGKQISVLTKGVCKSATVLGIDSACKLLVKYVDGTEESLSSGEISIQL